MWIFGNRSNIAADVNKFFRLLVSSVSRTHDNWKNGGTGEMWSANVSATPSATGKKFFYFKNGSNSSLKITDIRIEGATVGRIEVSQVTGTAAGGATVTPKSRNLGLNPSISSSATVESGADITGLTAAGNPLFYIPVPVINTEYHLKTSSNIVVSPGTAVALNWVGSTGLVTGTVSIVANGDDE